MTVTISRLYDDYTMASQAVRDWRLQGLASDQISIVASQLGQLWYRDKTSRKSDKIDKDRDGTDDRVEAAETGAGNRRCPGRSCRRTRGFGHLGNSRPRSGRARPRWLAAAATGAVAGGATGGIIGALTQAGVNKEEAHVYAEGVRRGGTLVDGSGTGRTKDAL
jgi:hypothetical protein